jgi:hypothetical protein
MKHIVSLAVGLTLTFLALPSITTAQVPNQMQYQGYLTDDGGSPLDTTVDMEFVIYDDSIGSGTVWTETHLDVTVENGLFEVILGSVSGVTQDVVSDSVRWLGTTVGDDSEIYPRTKLITVPYAFRVSTVDGATGGTISGDVEIQGDILGNQFQVKGNVLGYNYGGEINFNQDDLTIQASTNDPIIFKHGGVDETARIQADGNVAIGTTIASEKLDVNGNINVNGKITYGSPRTHYFVIGGEGFLPDRNLNYGNSGSHGGAYIESGGPYALAAPVHLPQGAVVTEFKVFFMDTSSSDVSVGLKRLYLSTGGYATMADVSSSGISGYDSQTDATISYATIDNTVHGYCVRAYCTSWDGWNLRIMGALITYTIDEAF